MQPGQPTPDFVLQDSSRALVSRADLEGGPWAFVFFPAAFTRGCTNELLEFQRLLPELTREGVSLAGVSTDTWATNHRFRVETSLDFPLLSDWPSGATCEAFGVRRSDGRAERVTVLFDPRGDVLEVITGVAAAEHAERTLEAVRRWRSAD